jgi:uncharacterized membrane protein
MRERLHALSDGIFAIVMTLLVLELHVPELAEKTSVSELWVALVHLGPIFFSFALSFAVVFGYWRAHIAIVSHFIENIDVRILNNNLPFLFFICLVPFSTSLLGSYPYNQLAIWVYGINISLIGFGLFGMRYYADKAEHIMTSARWTKRDRRNSNIRTFAPAFITIVAAVSSIYHPRLAYAFLLVSLLINLTTRGFDWLYAILDHYKIGIE